MSRMLRADSAHLLMSREPSFRKQLKPSHARVILQVRNSRHVVSRGTCLANSRLNIGGIGMHRKSQMWNETTT